MIDVVQYPGLPAPNWYARMILPERRTWHSDPYLTRTAAEYHARALRLNPQGWMRRNSANR